MSISDVENSHTFTGLCLHLKLKLKNHFICHSTKIYYLLITCRKQRESQNIGSGKSPIIFFWIIKNNLAFSYFCDKVRLVSGLLPHDYVAAFVKDVNRAKVLRAKTIMLSPEKYTANGKGSGETHNVLENSFIDEFLPLVLEKRSVVEVIYKDGNTMGFITEKELAQSLSKT